MASLSIFVDLYAVAVAAELGDDGLPAQDSAVYFVKCLYG